MKTKIILGLGMLVAVFCGAYYATQTDVAVGSVIPSGEYKATSTRSFNGTQLTNLTVLKSSSGTLGSVVITGANAAGAMTLYDATTSDATKRTKTATTTLVVIPATTLANTYTYDISFYNGLLIDMASTVGSTTITYR